MATKRNLWYQLPIGIRKFLVVMITIAVLIAALWSAGIVVRLLNQPYSYCDQCGAKVSIHDTSPVVITCPYCGRVESCHPAEK